MNRRELFLLSSFGGVAAVGKRSPGVKSEEGALSRVASSTCEPDACLIVSSLDELRSRDPALGTVILSAGYLSGIFNWLVGDLSSVTKADPSEIIFVKSAIAAVRQGCWVRSFSGPIDVRWAGAVPAMAGSLSMQIDNSKAINAALTLAAKLGGAVHVPQGNWGIQLPIVVPEGVTLAGAGCANLDSREGRSGTNLFALSAMAACLLVSSNTKLSLFSVSGRYLADVGIRWDSGARPSASDLQVGHCRIAAYLLDSTQNGYFSNLCGRFSGTCFLLANQARNNRFFNATGEVNKNFTPKSVYDQSSLITLLSDFGDTRKLGLLSRPPMKQGNDRNEFFGGIFERAPLAVRVISDGAHLDRAANAGTTIFRGTELTARQIISTREAPAYRGRLVMDNTVWISDDEVTPMTVGEAGLVSFQGDVTFSGAGELPLRGISMPSNYLHFLFSDVVASSSDLKAGIVDEGLTWWDKDKDQVSRDRGTFEVRIGSGRNEPHIGLHVRTGGSADRGNNINATRSLSQTNSVVEVLFTLIGIPHTQDMYLYVDQVEEPYRQLIGKFGSGTHSVLHRFSSRDMAQFTFGRGTIGDDLGVALWSVSNLVISFRG